MAARPLLLEEALQAGVLLLEALAALVILAGGLRAGSRYAAMLVRIREPDERRGRVRQIRQQFAASLLLGLDFAIGSDTLAVSLAPTLEAVLLVALVVAVRTALTLVLEHELRSDRREAARA